MTGATYQQKQHLQKAAYLSEGPGRGSGDAQTSHCCLSVGVGSDQDEWGSQEGCVSLVRDIVTIYGNNKTDLRGSEQPRAAQSN